MPRQTTRYTKTVTPRWAPKGTRKYDVTVTRRVPYKSKRQSDGAEAAIELVAQMVRALVALVILGSRAFKWFLHANRKAPSFDKQLWLSSTGQTWLTLWERMRNGVPHYDLYIYSPGDFVWNLIGTCDEYPKAGHAKNEWLSYVEQGGTYQMWLSQQTVES